jgi:hypothetical protein
MVALRVLTLIGVLMSDALDDLQAANDPLSDQSDDSQSEPSFHANAATISTWLAAAAGVIGLVAMLLLSGKDVSWLRSQALGASLLLLVASFGLGVIALCGIGKIGAATILRRVSGALLIGLVFIGGFAVGAVRHAAQIDAVYARQLSDSLPIPAKMAKLAPPLTDTECDAFARDVEEHFAAGDKRFFINAFDVDAMLDRLSSGKGDIADQMRAHRAEFKKGFEAAMNASLSKVRTLKCIHVRRVNGEARWLCRLVTTEGGLAYGEAILARVQGNPRIVDMLIYTTGETMSQTLDRLYLLPAVESQTTFVDRLVGHQPDIVKYFSEWSQLPVLNANGKHAEVIGIYAKLPPDLQKEKIILMAELEASIGTDSDAYHAAVDLWRRTYPNDPATDLISIPVLTSRGQFAEALVCVDRLDHAIGGDPYLDVLRSSLYGGLGDTLKAKEAATRAMEQEPTLLEPYYFLLHCLSGEYHAAEAIPILDKLCAVANLQRAQLAKILEPKRDYAALVASPEYRQWRTADDPTGGASGANHAKTKPVVLKLQGIIFQENHESALINGKYVMVGDEILGHKVTAIDAERVMLTSTDGTKLILETR